MNGYSIAVIPRSWGFGLWRKKLKSVFAFGPFRFVIHRGLGEWKQPKEPQWNAGVWLTGSSPSERLTRSRGWLEGGPEVLAGGALEPITYKRAPQPLSEPLGLRLDGA